MSLMEPSVFDQLSSAATAARINLILARKIIENTRIFNCGLYEPHVTDYGPSLCAPC